MLISELENQGNTLFKYRGQLPVALLLAGLVVYYFTEEIEIPYWTYLSLGVALFGQVIRMYAIGHTPKNTSGRNTQEQVADSVNTLGVYSIVRHPLYVGNFFMWLGGALLSQNIPFILIFILIFWLFYERVMMAEEQFLFRKFGNVYSDWAQRTPAFIPRFSQWKGDQNPFSWKVILKREDAPVFNLFFVFFAFELLRMYKYQLPFELNNAWFILFGFGTIQLIVLVFLRKGTKVLA